MKKKDTFYLLKVIQDCPNYDNLPDKVKLVLRLVLRGYKNLRRFVCRKHIYIHIYVFFKTYQSHKLYNK